MTGQYSDSRARRDLPPYEVIKGAPLTADRLEYLETNNLLPQGWFPDLIVATAVDHGRLVYAFVILHELTGNELIELSAGHGGRSEGYLLKHVILELIN